MNDKTKHEVEKRIKQMPELTKEQIRILEQRIKKHKETYGTLDHQGLFGKLAKLFR